MSLNGTRSILRGTEDDPYYGGKERNKFRVTALSVTKRDTEAINNRYRSGEPFVALQEFHFTSLPRFSVRNHVLVNRLVFVILIGGLIFALTLVREMFPESRPTQLTITAVYPGVQPQEIEKAVTLTFGLIFATLLTLLVVPTINMIFFDLRSVLRKIAGKQEVEPEVEDQTPLPSGVSS